ncbi:acyltransferase [Spiractinospora alimapuensis]|nr:acyltransferase [Spiractinospora alimapuensis]
MQNHGTPSPASRAPHGPDPAAARPRAQHRPEIEGLRAVAVILIVAYHVWLGRVSGGVDVFLLLTGFLITGSLVRTVERDGWIRFSAFWGRLLARLTPPVGVVLLGVLVATALWLPESRWRDVIADTVAAALYVENWHLATNAVDYLARDDAVSPLQHFWSLSIQGQFYLLWPLLVTLVVVLARWRGWSPRTAIGAALSVVLLVSLTYSVWSTAVDQTWAYFDTGARLWELALGGLLSLALPLLSLPVRPRVVLGWLGLAGLVSCGLVLQVSTLFPGWIALWPTGAAALVIVAGVTGHRLGADRILVARPLAYVGSLSYSLYLWHWPVLVVYLEVANRAVASLHGGLVVIAVSVLLSVATKWLVEDGVRHLTRRWAVYATAAAGLAFLLPAMTVAGGWATHLDRAEAERQRLAEDRDLYPGATVVDWRDGTAPEAPVLPRPADARGDLGENERPGGCHESFEGTRASVCDDGPADAEHTIALVGQSHAAHWYTALRDAAEAQGWRLVTMTKGACQFSTEPSWRGEDEYVECGEWNTDVMRQLTDLPPDVLVTTATRSSPGNGEQVLDGYVDRWRELDAMGVDVIGIRDTPRMGMSPPDCVADNGATSPECETDITRSLAEVPPYAEEPAVPESMEFVDLTDYFCPDGRCPSVIGNVLVYYDDSHITATYSATLAPIVSAEIQRVTGW